MRGKMQVMFVGGPFEMSGRWVGQLCASSYSSVARCPAGSGVSRLPSISFALQVSLGVIGVASGAEPSAENEPLVLESGLGRSHSVDTPLRPSLVLERSIFEGCCRIHIRHKRSALPYSFPSVAGGI